jgi:hypothetical protein
MLLILAATTQTLIPARRGATQRFADNAVLASLGAAVLQTAAVPLQAVASLLASVTRICAFMLVLVFVKMYNAGVAHFFKIAFKIAVAHFLKLLIIIKDVLLQGLRPGPCLIFFKF